MLFISYSFCMLNQVISPDLPEMCINIKVCSFRWQDQHIDREKEGQERIFLNYVHFWLHYCAAIKSSRTTAFIYLFLFLSLHSPVMTDNGSQAWFVGKMLLWMYVINNPKFLKGKIHILNRADTEWTLGGDTQLQTQNLSLSPYFTHTQILTQTHTKTHIQNHKVF